MKLKTILFLMFLFSLTASFASAAPERLQVKAADKRVKERASKAQIKNIELRNIEDPEARKAIGEILNYLNLQAKK